MKYQDLINKVEMFHKLAFYGDRTQFLKALSQENGEDLFTKNADNPYAGNWTEPPVQTAKETFIAGTPPSSKIKDVQHALNELGSPITLAEDGSLGPDTQKALEWFRNTYKIPPAIQGQALYTQIVNENNSRGYKMVDLDNPPQKNKIPFPHEMNEQMAQRNKELALENAGDVDPLAYKKVNEFVAKK